MQPAVSHHRFSVLFSPYTPRVFWGHSEHGTCWAQLSTPHTSKGAGIYTIPYRDPVVPSKKVFEVGLEGPVIPSEEVRLEV